MQEIQRYVHQMFMDMKVRQKKQWYFILSTKTIAKYLESFPVKNFVTYKHMGVKKSYS